MNRSILVIGLLLVNAGVAGDCGADPIRYSELCGQVCDLERVAVLPCAGERTVLFSSYDRRSQLDETNGAYRAWYANDDDAGIVRMESGSAVLVDVVGPGCIRRIWSAQPGEGRLQFRIDGEVVPGLSGSFRWLLDPVKGPFGGLTNLVCELAGGRNCFVPISFARSCQVLAEPEWGRYYQFSVSLFGTNADVESIGMPFDERTRCALAEVDARLGRCGESPWQGRTGAVSRVAVEVPAGGVAALPILAGGPRAIVGLRVRMRPGVGHEAERVLRELVVRIGWDGEEKYSVWCPLGDFFGTAPGVNLYQSLPMGMTEDGFYSYWFMPYAESAAISMVNEGAQAREVEWEITTMGLDRPVGEYGRFHAKFHRGLFNPVDPERRKHDWTVLRTEGRGRFVGLALHVFNPHGKWWGEGDERFYVDGEVFPSWFGTGSEDYFGYAWANPGLFGHALQNQPRCDGNHRFHVSNNRWQLGDSIPFGSSFLGTIEKEATDFSPTRYAATAYWYLDAGGTDPYDEPVALLQRTGYFGYLQPAGFEAVSGVFAKPLRLVTGAEVQRLGAGAECWSGDGVPPGPFVALPSIVATNAWRKAFFKLGVGVESWQALRVSVEAERAGTVHLLVSGDALEWRAWVNGAVAERTPRVVEGDVYLHDCFVLPLRAGTNRVHVGGRVVGEGRVRLLVHGAD